MPSSVKHQLNLYKINSWPLSSKGPWIVSKLCTQSVQDEERNSYLEFNFSKFPWSAVIAHALASPIL